MLMRAAARGEPYHDTQFREKLESDIWNIIEDRDTIGPMVGEFVAGVEKHCLPVVAYRYAQKGK